MKKNLIKVLILGLIAFVLIISCEHKGGEKNRIHVVDKTEIIEQLSKLKNNAINAYAEYVSSVSNLDQISEAKKRYSNLQAEQNVLIDKMIADLNSGKRISRDRNKEYYIKLRTLNESTKNFVEYTNKTRNIGFVITIAAEILIAYISNDNVSDAEYVKAQTTQLENLKLPPHFEIDVK